MKNSGLWQIKSLFLTHPYTACSLPNFSADVRERESVCVCVDGFIVECPHSPPPLLYTLRLGLMIRLGAL